MSRTFSSDSSIKNKSEGEVLYRFDLIFSYWVVVWWFLYMAQRTLPSAPSFFEKTLSSTPFFLETVIISPKLAILLGIVENIGLFVLLWIMNAPYTKLWMFVSTVLLIKLFPLWTVWNIPLEWKKELFYTVCLFLIYIAWLIVNGVSVYVQTGRLFRELRKKGQVSKEVAPMVALIQRITGWDI